MFTFQKNSFMIFEKLNRQEVQTFKYPVTIIVQVKRIKNATAGCNSIELIFSKIINLHLEEIDNVFFNARILT